MTRSDNRPRAAAPTEPHRSAPVRRRASPSLTFLGGAGTPTGARYLVETPGARILVGCGAFAGPANLVRRNWSPAVDALRSLDAVVLTGADAAHGGFLPQLAAEGFTGPVFATPGTATLLPVALAEAAAQFAEEEATERPGFPPPFGSADVDPAVALLRPVAETAFRDIGLAFGRAGGQPGAAWAHLRAGDRSVLFSSPLGSANHPLVRGPELRPDAETLVLPVAPVAGRATGHEAGRLAAAVHRAVRRGGSVLVPASATGRAAVVLTLLRDLMDAREIPLLPVHLDGPAGLQAVAAYEQAGPRSLRLPEDLFVHPRPGDAGWWDDGPSIVLAGPETAGPGRVLDHLARLLPDARNVVVVAGPRLPGTRSAELAAGQRHLKIRGRYVPVRAEIICFADFGEYADEAAVRDWATAGASPETVFVVEGEPDAALATAKALHAEAGWCAVVPADGERVLL